MNSLICQNEKRRDQVRVKTQLYGLDFLEVEPDRRTLTVHFLGKAPAELDASNFVIEGGRRIRDIGVDRARLNRFKHPELDDTAEVVAGKEGDFSTYTLRVIERDADGRIQRHSAFDPRYDRIEFSFKVDCPSDLDCKEAHVCPPEQRARPAINYLAKDYASFRQLIFDRLALLMPGWRERHVPDLGVALVELLAYTGDYLSYYQDAVATEAYLDTARRRVSVRRHARLVDYQLHEGCNARAWVCIEVAGDLALDPRDVYFITNAGGALPGVGATITEDDLRRAPAGRHEIFEPMADAPIKLYPSHNEIRFYTWGDAECCLERGATSATLIGALAVEPPPEEPDDDCDPPDTGATIGAGIKTGIETSSEADSEASVQQRQQGQQGPPPVAAPADTLHLKPGDVLIFEEVIGAATGNSADADPAHRHAVRLTRVEAFIDSLNEQPVVEIEWAAEDALPFPLCISALGPPPACGVIENAGIVRGNVVLCDHGRTYTEDLGVVELAELVERCEREGMLADVELVARRFNPRLKRAPLVFAQPPDAAAAASRALRQDVRGALPRIALRSIAGLPGGDAPLFEWGDVDRPAALISRLRAATSEAAKILRDMLSRKTLETLNAIKEESDKDEHFVALQEALAAELRAMIETWLPQADLFGSHESDRHFVVEIENDGRAVLRFGDDEMGDRPEAGQAFQAVYRAGGGPAGNVGAEAITTLVTVRESIGGGILRLRNPLAAAGGAEPEPMAEAKLFAPRAFRKTLERAVTAEDYAAIAAREFPGDLQNASAVLQWTGSWYEALVVVDPYEKEKRVERRGSRPEAALLEAIGGRLHRFRRAGHDLVVEAAVRVPLEIVLEVCALPGHQRGHVKAALLDALGARLLPGGRSGFFHPDNLTFGEGIFLSKLVAAAQSIEGVESVVVKTLQRKFAPSDEALITGVLLMGPLEIAQLDNDPGFPEHGTLKISVSVARA